MLKLDNSLLDELGLGALPEDQKRAMLQHIYDTLELRVGTNLANQMTDAQLEEFERFIDNGGEANQAQALQWLETNLPNYKQVVNDVFEALKMEIKQMAPQLMAASGVPPRTTQPVGTPQYSTPASSLQPAGWMNAQQSVVPRVPDAAVPPTPMGLTAIAVNSTQVNLSWSAGSSDNFTGAYSIYRNGSQIGSVNATVFTDQNLNPSTTYVYYVTASDSFGKVSAPSNTVSVLTPQPASAIGNLPQVNDSQAFPAQQPPAGPGGY